MDRQALIKWAKSAAVAVIGGGIAAALTAASDPQKYNIAHDLGSGKLWEFFLEGAGVTFGALLLKSPLGQQVMGSYKGSQAQLQQSRQDIEQAKADLKAPEPPPTGPPPARK